MYLHQVVAIVFMVCIQSNEFRNIRICEILNIRDTRNVMVGTILSKINLKWISIHDLFKLRIHDIRRKYCITNIHNSCQNEIFFQSIIVRGKKMVSLLMDEKQSSDAWIALEYLKCYVICNPYKRIDVNDESKTDVDSGLCCFTFAKANICGGMGNYFQLNRLFQIGLKPVLNWSLFTLIPIPILWAAHGEKKNALTRKKHKNLFIIYVITMQW